MQTVELADGVAELPRDEWNALVGEESPFLEWDWLASLEHAGTVGANTGWHPKPLVIRDENRLIAACPLYLKGNSAGEFVFDHAWADAAGRAGVPYYPKLLVGVPFTPVTGARFLLAPGVDRPETIRLLGSALRQICRNNDMSSVHINFCTPEEVDALSSTGDSAETADTNDYQLRVGFQYHWQNHDFESFDDYLAQFRSKRRNQIKRERRELDKQGVEIEALVGDEIADDLFDPLYQCYLSTIESRYWGRQYLNREFFALLSERFRNRLCFIVARKDGEVIAGTTNVVKGGVLYGRYWGALMPARHLHFNVCYYAAIEHCIHAGLERFEPGAGGDYKYLRGFDAQPTHSLHYIAEPGFARAVARFLAAEREDAREIIDHLRENRVLKS
ncbi:MAG: GNAT family N-acetyltransferase [Myxococcota bacterium]